jgi:hypothetical protein
MTEQINANEPKILINDLSASSLPSLPDSLNSFYNGLNSFNRGVFVKIYRYIWGVVNWKTINRGEYVSYYWLLYGQAVRLSLPPYSLALLSYIYYMSDQGRNIIHSDKVYYSGVLPGYQPHCISVVLSRLVRQGYIKRSTRDISAPYLARSINKHKVFISMTIKGVQLLDGITKDINKILLNTSLNDLTGVSNKKP